MQDDVYGESHLGQNWKEKQIIPKTLLQISGLSNARRCLLRRPSRPGLRKQKKVLPQTLLQISGLPRADSR